MIVKQNRKIESIFNKRYPLKMVYRKGYLVWSKESGPVEAQSCFGRGYWVNTLPWLNNDGWKNN